MAYKGRKAHLSANTSLVRPHLPFKLTKELDGDDGVVAGKKRKGKKKQQEQSGSLFQVTRRKEARKAARREKHPRDYRHFQPAPVEPSRPSPPSPKPSPKSLSKRKARDEVSY